MELFCSIKTIKEGNILVVLPLLLQLILSVDVEDLVVYYQVGYHKFGHVLSLKCGFDIVPHY